MENKNIHKLLVFGLSCLTIILIHSIYGMGVSRQAAQRGLSTFRTLQQRGLSQIATPKSITPPKTPLLPKSPLPAQQATRSYSTTKPLAKMMLGSGIGSSIGTSMGAKVKNMFQNIFHKLDTMSYRYDALDYSKWAREKDPIKAEERQKIIQERFNKLDNPTKDLVVTLRNSTDPKVFMEKLLKLRETYIKEGNINTYNQLIDNFNFYLINSREPIPLYLGFKKIELSDDYSLSIFGQALKQLKIDDPQKIRYDIDLLQLTKDLFNPPPRDKKLNLQPASQPAKPADQTPQSEKTTSSFFSILKSYNKWLTGTSNTQ